MMAKPQGYLEVKQEIRAALLEAIKAMGAEDLSSGPLLLERPKEQGHGDLATGLPFQLAKSLHRPPRAIAEDIAKHLSLDKRLVERVEVAGGGFINFFLGTDWLFGGIADLLRDPEGFGRSDFGQGQKVQVEFVSANPTGPLTVGHGRQAAIGDSIARLLERIGCQVTREYYFNNAGNQMALLARSVHARYLELQGKDAAVPEEGYQGEYIKDIAKAILGKRGSGLGEKDLSLFKDEAEAAIFTQIKATLSRLGVSFDVFFNETALHESGKVKKTIAVLKKAGYAYESEGALWLKAQRFGIEKDRVLVKATGEPTYRLVDMAYHQDKLARGFDHILDIFGADHHSDAQDVLAGVKALGLDASKIEVIIHQFVTLSRGGEKVRMSKRAATYVTLDELIEEVGADVVRFFFLMRRHEAHLDFDLDLAKKQSDENPVYYVQYAHARIANILRHAGEQGVSRWALDKVNFGLLCQPEEMALIKQVMDFPELVLGAATSREPHRIPVYLQDLAGVFHNFYHQHRVVTEDEPLTQARLCLVEAVQTVMCQGLQLIGVTAPERM
jgi:arginyl-tRNA synthetase